MLGEGTPSNVRGHVRIAAKISDPLRSVKRVTRFDEVMPLTFELIGPEQSAALEHRQHEDRIVTDSVDDSVRALEHLSHI